MIPPQMQVNGDDVGLWLTADNYTTTYAVMRRSGTSIDLG